MRVVIDGRRLCNTPTGIGNYLRDVIVAIANYLPNWELVVVMPEKINSSFQGLPIDKVTFLVEPISNRIRFPFILWYHFKFPMIARRLKADVVWGMEVELPLLSCGRCIKVITIYDVVWKEYRDTMTTKAKIAKVPFFNRSVKKADKIICISQYTKDKINLYFPHKKCKDIAVGCTCSNMFRRRDIPKDSQNQIKVDHGIGEKFILFVGTLEPRKNLSFLLQLMPEIYQRTEAKLLVVGGKGWKNNNIRELVDNVPEIRESVVFANYVSVEELITLYHLATCYVSTSLNEGFGLPQLEAMRCGCPVISPYNSAMIEVVEGRGVTIKGWNEKEWIYNIVRMLEDDDYRNTYCHPDISMFEWERIIKNFDKYIREI